MSGEIEKGMSVFLDVFRRADKNDDNCLSLDEFKSFFGDGVLTNEELENLFHQIDTHNTNNIDTGELCEYFKSHLGPFKDIFASLEDLSGFVSLALQKMAEEYPTETFHQQFTLRFLLKEVSGQFMALTKNLDFACDHLEHEALKDRPGNSQVAVVEPVRSSSAGWVARRTRRQLSTQTSVPGEGMNLLTAEVNRLADLVARLEQKVKIDPVDEDTVTETNKGSLAFIVSRKFSVLEEKDRSFRDNLRTYVDAAGRDDGCVSISVRMFEGTCNYAVYEIWETEEDWKANFAGAKSKSFRRENVDLLDIPEQLSSMAIPAKWIIKNDAN
ncbi:N-terminal EF-hand calcium-binding protein 1-like [Diadema setosum]|uniref:N-terminal EF-hand calcium-binding protein 1-like n=1 Tax=Diadema setosum TaxID=31175 RepID=UPI003B3B6AE4